MVVIDCLKTGPVKLHDTTISGTLDFRSVLNPGPTTVNVPQVYENEFGGFKFTGRENVDKPCNVCHAFICNECQFAGLLIGSGVAFAGPMLFVGSQFEQPVLMEGTFIRRVDFTLARFDDRTTFENARFGSGASFRLAQFSQDAIFTNATFKSASFDRAAFATTADFRLAKFTGFGSFGATTFAGRAEFDQASFEDEAWFNLAQFGGNASFFAAKFFGIGPQAANDDYSATFDTATARGNIDFSQARFLNKHPFSLDDFSSAGTISFVGATFSKTSPTAGEQFKNVTANDLVMSVPQVMSAVDPQFRHDVLELVQSGAAARGDLGTANDAHYELRVLSANQLGQPLTALDKAFYGEIAGYLVRPFHPLVALLVLASLLSLIRVMRARRAEPAAALGPPGPLRELDRMRSTSSQFGHELLDTLTLVGPGGSSESGRRVSRPEILTYRVLLVCAVLGIAASNPTLREMLNALH